MIQIVTFFTIFFPFFSLPLVSLGLYFDRKYRLQYAILIAMILSMIAYTLNPMDGGLDLSVYFAQMDDIANLDLNKFILFLQDSTEPLFVILLYFVSKTNDYHLLPCITTFIIYSIYFFILYDYYKSNKIKHNYEIFGMILVIVLFRFIYTISGIRNPLAISIFAIIFYYDLYKGNTYKMIPMYIIPCLIHNSIIILVSIRVFTILILNKKGKFSYIINLLIIIGFVGIINILLNSELFLDKTEYFIETYDSSFKILENKDFLMQQLIHILFIVVNFKLYKKNNDKKYLVLNIFNIVLLLAGQKVFFIFDRYFQLMILFNVMSLVNYLTKYKLNLILILICIIAFFFILQQIINILSVDFLIKENIFKNIITNLYNLVKIFIVNY